MTQQQIWDTLAAMRAENAARKDAAKKRASLLDYAHLTRLDPQGREIWSDAFDAALSEQDLLLIPQQDKPYFVDRTILLDSDTHILAEPLAEIKLVDGIRATLMRNRHNEDGSDTPETFRNPDRNISITGGIWTDSDLDAENKHGNNYFPGASGCLFFNQVDGLTLSGLTVKHSRCFAIQVGNLKNLVAEHITFRGSGSDGLHINGRCENVLVQHIRGTVSDDLVALNMYDWNLSSVDFGPLQTAWVEDLELPHESRYKAMRILPGIYPYQDGSKVHCSIRDVVVKKVRGINTFKFYMQTAPYRYPEDPPLPEQGEADNLYFEDIQVDLDAPVDGLEPYTQSHPVIGSIAAFEFGSFLGHVTLKDIRLTLHRDRYPTSYLACIGPKTYRWKDLEVFDPGLCSSMKKLTLENITLNGETVTDCRDLIREIRFADFYGDGRANGTGEFAEVTLDGRPVIL